MDFFCSETQSFENWPVQGFSCLLSVLANRKKGGQNGQEPDGGIGGPKVNQSPEMGVFEIGRRRMNGNEST